jgi:hypothetical protein
MAASSKTLCRVYVVLRDNISVPVLTKTLDELVKVSGNASFEATVRMLHELHKRALNQETLNHKAAAYQEALDRNEAV